MPKTDNLPDEWYDSPNAHLCTIKDFVDLVKKIDAEVDEAVAFNTSGRLLPIKHSLSLQNLLGEKAVFLLKRPAGVRRRGLAGIAACPAASVPACFLVAPNTARATGTRRVFSAVPTGSMTCFVASISRTPANPGASRVPTFSQKGAERSTIGRSKGGMNKARTQTAGVNMDSPSNVSSWLRLYGRPCPKGVVSRRAQTPRQFGTTVKSLPPGANTRHISRNRGRTRSATSRQ